MITKDDLVGTFKRNLGIIQAQTKGLTHADSVLQLPFRGNCLNWTLGHIVGNRSMILERIGAGALFTEEQSQRYGYGSEPVCADGDDILKLEELLALLEQSQPKLEAALEKLSDADMEAPTESFLGTTGLVQLVFYLLWHETYHTGATELLRQLAGKDDKVI